METIVGLDISSVCVGFSVFHDAELFEYGRYHQVGEHHGEKLSHFGAWLRELFTKHAPDQVIIERPYPVARKNTYGVLMLYIGMALAIHFSCRNQEIPLTNMVPAALVKRTLKVPKQDTYEERKQVMLNEVNKLYDLKLIYQANDRTKRISEDDTADSIALVRTWLLRYRQEKVNERGPDSNTNRHRRSPRKTSANG
jgi:hypothetical protein